MTEKTDATRNAVLVGAAVAVLIAVGHLYWQVDRMSSDILSLRQSVVRELARVQTPAQPAPSSGAIEKKVQAELGRLETLRVQLEDELNATRSQATAAAMRAKLEAVSQASKLVRALGDEHQSQHKEVAGEIGQVKQSTAVVSAKVEDVSADVASIKNQVEATRHDLERTVGDLKRMSGDLGVQTGLIATNARELAALRTLGERSYFDFHLERGKHPQRVGDVALVLKKTDAKNNRFTLEVIHGDKRTEKKDKSLNEALQFYLTRSPVPCEIVINEVQKDYVIGYLSEPKKQVVALRF
ncbi:MAG: hypothetical protein HYR60_00410 [Acidobacteria bacterium]|nr:hypothetical protein [Acidobacteriota bacterium]MBI3471077.1 hypothetical protein [Candidatus Solibacter usitatus]